MGNLNMSDNSSQNNDSDDLIEQLAKLMAKDAQAEQQTEQQAEQVAPVQADARSDGNNLSDVTIANDDIIVESTVDITVPTPLNEVDVEASADPIADLISAQLDDGEGQAIENADKTKTPVEKIEELKELNEDLQSPLDDSFSIPPVFGIGSNTAQNEPLSIDENTPEQSQDVMFEQVGVEKTAKTEETVAVIEEEIVAAIEMAEHIEAPVLPEVTAPNYDKQPAQPTDDPIIDIENLIGEAISAGNMDSPKNINSQNQTTAEPSFDDSLDSVDSAANAAESAILAASAEADNNTKEVNETKGEQLEKPKKSSFMAGVFGPAIAGTALLAIAFGLFWVLSDKTDNSGDVAPTLSSDNSPQKIDPPVTNDANSQASNSVIFNEISGETQPGNTEMIVSRDESSSSAETGVSRIIPTANSNETGLANRRVRTVTVRPDGTIVNGDSARAGNEILPVERPTVPQLPAGSTIEVPATAVTPPQVAVVEPIAIPTIANENITPANIVAPTPLIRPNNLKLPAAFTPPAAPAPTSSNAQAVNLIANNANQAIAPVAPPAATPASPVLSTTTAPAYVQLSSQREEATARQSMVALSARYANIFGNSKLEIQRVNLVDKGIFYRVRMPASSLVNANQICANIKQAGGDCFVRTN